MPRGSQWRKAKKHVWDAMTGPVKTDLNFKLVEIPDPGAKAAPSSAKVLQGRWFPPQQQVLLYSAEEWEALVEEWAHYLKTKYPKVVRLSGPGDMGIDVAAFTDASGLGGVWDNYQCKHYDRALTPGVAIPEIGKMLWHSFEGHYSAPRKYYFMAPKGCGLHLSKLLLKPTDLRAQVELKWNDWCATAITSKKTIPLTGAFADYVSKFNFSTFTFKTLLEVIDEHRKTPYHAARFGGGLGDRPTVAAPPSSPASTESRYLQQLFEAYSDSQKAVLSDLNALSSHPELVEHYYRQRETFYHAEALRNFARDTVPPGTFEDLQSEVHSGVVEVSKAPHADALVRLNAVTQAAALLPLTANGLISVTKVQDKKGICHQLANEDKLKWKKP